MNHKQGKLRYKQVSVWDVPLRVFHIGLILCVLSLLVTGFLSPEWWLSIHLRLGYLLVFLMLFRLVWGYFGSEYSRLGSLNLRLSDLKRWITTVFRADPDTTIGHNAPGSWMIITFFILLTLMILTGILIQGSENLAGPLATVTHYSQSELLIDLHKILAWSVLTTIVIHVLAVVLHDIVLKHRLIESMITGQKKVPVDLPNIIPAKSYGLYWALAVSVSITSAIVFINPEDNSRWYDVQKTSNYDRYANECSDCHFLYHPSLNSETNWTALMASLDDHYGEDASISSTSFDLINQFFNENNAIFFDTQAAVEIGLTASDNDRMTNRPFWKDVHANLNDNLFNSAPVYSSANCDACHLDADTGLFQDQNIQLPKIEENSLSKRK